MPIHIYPCSENLPARLANELANRSARDFSNVAVVVPSRRLGNYVRRALAERVTACLPPRICTLDELASLIPSPDRRQRISKTEQALILADLLRPGRFHYFVRGMEEDIARFFDELVDEDLLRGAFQKIRELLQRDEFKDERHLERLLQQTIELETLHDAYENFLDKNKLTDAARDLVARVKSLENGSLFALRSPRSASLPLYSSGAESLHEIYLLGFVDATAIQSLLLSHLVKKCDAQFWTHAESAFLIDDAKAGDDWHQRLNPFAPLAKLLSAIGDGASLNDSDPSSSKSANAEILKAAYGFDHQQHDRQAFSAAAPIHLREAATPLAEVKAAAALIRKLVHRNGIPPHQIVVVVPDEQIYGRLVWSVFAEAEIETNNSLGQPLLRTRSGQWLHLLLTLAQEDWRLAELISLLHHPFSEMWMRALNRDIPASIIQQIIEHHLIDEEISHGQSRIFDAVKAINDGSTDERIAAFGFLNEIQKALAPLNLEGEFNLAQWVDRFLQTLEHIQLERWIVMTGGGAYNLDGQALQIISGTLQEMQRIGQLLQEPFRFGDFFRLLNQQLFAATVRAVGEPHSDVQVMGLLESRSVPAEIFIVLGNNEGSFPAAVGRELFLEEPLRAQLGLTTYHKRELLQDMNFYRLAAGASRPSGIHLFYCRLHDDAPRVRSRFLERLLLLNAVVPGIVRVHQESGRLFESDFLLDKQAKAANQKLRERSRLVETRMAQRYDQRGGFPGNRAALLSNFSATTLQMLFHCPYRFLLHGFRIDSRELPTGEADSLVLGKWLHRVFQLFFQGITDPGVPLAKENEDLREPWTTAMTPQQYDAALDRLQRLGKLLMTSHDGQDHLFYHMLYVGWPAFIKQEIQRGRGIFQPEYFEFNIEDFLQATLAVGFHQVGVRGRVDRIFSTEDEIRLIDYKLSGFRGSQQSILDADEPQLPLYALALQATEKFSSRAKWTGEYWSIRHGESKTVLEKEDEGLAAAFANLVERWQQRLNQLHGGAPVDAEVTKYCEQCLYAGVCRREERHY